MCWIICTVLLTVTTSLFARAYPVHTNYEIGSRKSTKEVEEPLSTLHHVSNPLYLPRKASENPLSDTSPDKGEFLRGILTKLKKSGSRFKKWLRKRRKKSKRLSRRKIVLLLSKHRRAWKESDQFGKREHSSPLQGHVKKNGNKSIEKSDLKDIKKQLPPSQKGSGHFGRLKHPTAKGRPVGKSTQTIPARKIKEVGEGVSSHTKYGVEDPLTMDQPVVKPSKAKIFPFIPATDTATDASPDSLQTRLAPPTTGYGPQHIHSPYMYMYNPRPQGYYYYQPSIQGYPSSVLAGGYNYPSIHRNVYQPYYSQTLPGSRYSYQSQFPYYPSRAPGPQYWYHS